jgi:RNA polymerase sigma-70 factor (ECF subfamily)
VSEHPALETDELLTRALAGDAAAFGMLVRAQQRAVYSLALRMLSDRQKAEDLAQEVFLQLHRSLASVESGAHLQFWLRKVTVNRSIDRLRREPRFEALPLEAADCVACEAQGWHCWPE